MSAHSSPQSNFNDIVSRKNTDSLKWDKYRDSDVLPFWVADMDFPVAACIQKALANRIEHPLFGYSLPPKSLFEAFKSHVKTDFDWDIKQDWVVYLPGVVAGLAASCRAYADTGDEVVVNPPIYHHFYDSHEESRHTLIRVPLKKEGARWTYDLEAMAKSFNERTALLMMCTPHNPTGTVFTAAELRAVATLCDQHDVVMVSDEIHCDLVLDRNAQHVPTAKACPEHADRIITLMSGSKTWNLAGLNCSFAVISNPELRKQFQAALQSAVPHVPPLATVATEAAYRDGQQWRQDLLEYLRGNYELIEQALSTISGLNLEPLQATYLAWIDATELGLSDTQGFFEQHGVGFSSGEQFGQPQYVRMNFACPRKTLQEGLNRMRKAVDSLSREL